MDALNRLLERIKRSLDGDRLVKEEIVSSIKEVAGFEVSLEDVSLQNNLLRIKTSPAKRSEISLREKVVLEKIRQKTKLNLVKIVY